MKKKNDELIKKNDSLYQKASEGLITVKTSKNNFLGITNLTICVQQARFGVENLLSQYSKTVLLLLIGYLLVTNSSHAATAGPSGIYTKNIGYVWDGAVSESIQQQQVKKTYPSTPDVMRAALFAITLSPSTPCVSSSEFAYSSDGKAYGIKVAEDVIFVLNANAFGNVYRYNNRNVWEFIEGRATFSDLNISLTGYADRNINCPWDIGFQRSWSGGSDTVGNGGLVNADISGIGRLYIGPKARSGIVNFPAIYFIKSYVVSPFEMGFVSKTLIESSQFEILTLSCTVSAPPTIDFDQVPAKGDGWVPLASKDSTLQINCNSNHPDVTTATADISFTGGPLYKEHSEMLEMTTDGSYGVGILNGRYGQGNISNCSSTNSNEVDAVKFNGTVSKTLEFNVGINEIPITWTVCRRGDIQRAGIVSAQATANIDWY